MSTHTDRLPCRFGICDRLAVGAWACYVLCLVLPVFMLLAVLVGSLFLVLG